MVWATMPPAPIDEDRKARTGEHDVRANEPGIAANPQRVIDTETEALPV
jgi:hypothetical protein